MRRLLARSLFAMLIVMAAACGADDDEGSTAGAPDDTIEVEMVDNAFEPAEVEVAAGEEVTFVFDNDGAALHEAYVGDEAAQAEHVATMRTQEADGDGEEHGGGHGDAEVLEVEPGADGELTHTFDEPGEYLLGCHQPGHYEDGMKMRVTVT